MAYDTIDNLMLNGTYVLGVFGNRYGGGYIAAMCWHMDLLLVIEDDYTGGDDRGCSVSEFFSTNDVYPAAWGETPSAALAELETKLKNIVSSSNYDYDKWNTLVIGTVTEYHNARQLAQYLEFPNTLQVAIDEWKKQLL
jgi:hypothetical protein